MTQLHEYTTDELLDEIRRRMSFGSSSFDMNQWNGKFKCAQCGQEFTDTHICLGKQTTAVDYL